MATMVKVEFPVMVMWYAADKDAAELMATVDSEQGITRRQANGEAVKATAIDLPLPELRGGDKQVAWARDIRNTMLRAYAQRMTESDAARVTVAMRQMFGSTSAKLYIDSRNSDAMFRQLRRAELAAAK